MAGSGGSDKRAESWGICLCRALGERELGLLEKVKEGENCPELCA